MYHLKITGLTVMESDLRRRSRLKNDRPVLSNVSLSVLRGEFFGITGPNGCGKTTLLRAVAGLVEPSDGEILKNGENLGAVKPACRGVAMVFQEFSLYPDLTGRQNVAFPLHIREGLSISPDARLAERITGHPDEDLFRIASMLRLDRRKILERRPKAVSLGERQRIAIGKALAAKPEILLLDEPFSNIEEDFRAEFRSRLKKFLAERNITTLLVTNNPRELSGYAETLGVMSDGRMEQIGAYGDLYDNPRTLTVAVFLGDIRPNVIRPGDVSKASGGKWDCLMVIRPEHCVLGDEPGSFHVSGEVSFVQQFLPEHRKAVFVDYGKELFGVMLPGDHPVSRGDRIVISAPFNRGMFFAENHEGSRERIYNIGLDGLC